MICDISLWFYRWCVEVLPCLVKSLICVSINYLRKEAYLLVLLLYFANFYALTVF